jgi:hypothetical protein
MNAPLYAMNTLKVETPSASSSRISASALSLTSVIAMWNP